MDTQDDTELRRRHVEPVDTTQNLNPSPALVLCQASDATADEEPNIPLRNMGYYFRDFLIRKHNEEIRRYEKRFERELRRMGYDYTREQWLSEVERWLGEAKEFAKGFERFDENTTEEEKMAYYRTAPKPPARTPDPAPMKKPAESKAPLPPQGPVWKEPEVDEWLWFKNTLATLCALAIVFLVVGSLWYLINPPTSTLSRWTQWKMEKDTAGSMTGKTLPFYG